MKKSKRILSSLVAAAFLTTTLLFTAVHAQPVTKSELNQSQTTGASGSLLLNTFFGQTFTPTRTGKVDSIQVLLKRALTSTSSVTLKLYNTDADGNINLLSSSITGYTSTINISYSGNYTWAVFSFTDANRPELTADTLYGFEVMPAIITTLLYHTYGGNLYDRGTELSPAGLKTPGSDLNFKVYLTPTEYTVTFMNGATTYGTPQSIGYGYDAVAPVTNPTKTGYTFTAWDDYTNITAARTVNANYSINQYSITFNSNGGSAVTAITQDYATTVTAPTDPTKTGYTFAGWYSDEALNTPYSFTTMPAGSITLYAKWTINDYTITFDSNGGSAVTAITQNYATTVTKPTDPTKAGYTFVGWCSDEALTTPYTFTTMPAENITLYADWSINEYTITFDSNGGSAVTAITQDYATTVTKPTDPTKTGYTFAGWYSDEALNTPYSFTTMPAENITLYAKWTINDYTITFDSNDGSAVTAITQNYATTVTAPTAPTKAGYTFAGWYSDEALTTTYTFTTMPAENITLYANWAINPYTITFDSNGGSAVTAITKDFATTVTAPTAPTKAGYTFTGWYSDEALTTPYTFTTMPAENITLYAQYDKVLIVNGDNQIEATGDGSFSEDAEFIVNDVTSQLPAGNLTQYNQSVFGLFDGYEIAKLYELKLLIDDEPAQLDGTVRVRIKLSPELLAKASTLKFVYINDAGVATDIPFTIEGEYLVFTTNHFSYYAIATLKATPNPQESDNFNLIGAFALMLAAGTVLILTLKKRRTQNQAK